MPASRTHGYRDPEVAFDPAGDGSFHGDGTTWDGATGRAADGRRLERVPTKRLYAFTWQDDHGPDAFYDGPARSVSAGSTNG